MSKSPPRSPQSSPSLDPDQLCGILRGNVHARLRASVLQAVQQMFEEEVERLCGKPYSRKKGSTAHRAGSDMGSIVIGAQRVAVRKPRVKQNGKEIHLQSYQLLQDTELFRTQIVRAMLSGVSTRDYEKLLEPIPGGGKGVSAASISRAFSCASQKALDELNSRDLAAQQWVVLIIDTIHFSNRAVISALGINAEGNKVILGVREGDSENAEVAKDLLVSLVERGFASEHVLYVLDGSQALRKAVRACFGSQALVQRCSVHKERNIKAYLPKSYHSEFARRWKMLHGTVDYQEALRLHDSLRKWLAQINLSAAQSLDEAKGEILTVIRLETPESLRPTLRSTNCIESCYGQVRKVAKRVKNWNKGKNQVARWGAAGALEAEKGFRKIRGYREMSLLVEKIKEYYEADV